MLQPVYHYLLSWTAALWYRWPSEKLIVIGVTGTTGKTTSVYLMAKMLESAGYKVGYTSTAMFNDGVKEWLNDKKMTMPGRFFTQKIICAMVRNKCQYAIIETTSEGIRQFRHKFINYDILVFTGLYPEHIESHGSFTKYKEAKGKLFAHLKNCKAKYVCAECRVAKQITGIKKLDLARVKKCIIANGDDENAEYFLNFWAEDKLMYTKTRKHSVSPQNTKKQTDKFKIVEYGEVKVDSDATSFKVNNLLTGFRTGKKISLQLLGEFNAANALNVVCVGLALEIDFEKIRTGLENISEVPGRFEKITSTRPSSSKGEGAKEIDFAVIVDYAFEPNAVNKLYETLKLVPHKKVIHVLGSAGGGRDKARRPMLGKIAGEKADYVIVTNEDPYDEDPQAIIDQVAEGAIKAGKKINDVSASSARGDLFKILDRKEAIKKAISLAGKNDVVLITGKGSEQAMCLAHGEKQPWDDREVVREILSKKG